MSFERPSLTTLVDRIQADFVSRLVLSGAVLRRSMVYVLSRVLAGAVHLLYGFLDWIFRQIFADSSDDENLLRQASLYGLAPKTASYAQGTATVSGTNGTVIPAGSSLTRSDAESYTVDADVTISSSTGTLALTAVNAGAVQTLGVDEVLGFDSPIAGVSATATVTASTVDGVDQESTEEFRARFLAFLQAPPSGGNSADYVAWAKEVAGVTRAWVYPAELGLGTVVVRFVRDDDADRIPDSGEVADVQAHIDGVRPVTATVTVDAPTDAVLDLTLHLNPDTTDRRTAVSDELAAMLIRESSPGTVTRLSHIRTAIGTALGETDDYTLTVPSADVTHTTGQLAKLGTITWT